MGVTSSSQLVSLQTAQQYNHGCNAEVVTHIPAGSVMESVSQSLGPARTGEGQRSQAEPHLLRMRQRTLVGPSYSIRSRFQAENSLDYKS